jgi:aminopeptidase N
MQSTETGKNLEYFRLNSLSFLLLFIFIGCKTEKDKNPTLTETIKVSAKDPHSYANIAQIRTKHLSLELEVNFDNKTLYGVARHQMSSSNSKTAIFDINGESIRKVTTGIKGHEKEADFVIGKMDKDSIIGQPLVVTIPKGTTEINIYYQTTARCDALEWIEAENTLSKTQPYLYSQGQAILTRSWIPIQDSPSNRFTYDATIRVNPGLMVLMSAKNPTKKAKDGVYHFVMDQPIPSYLIALTVGDIAYKALDYHSGVYAETPLLSKAAKEFADLPRMIKAAEKLYGPYAWEQYDVIVQHKSFPFGGMENPRLTFINPSIVAGDKSLVSVIAHELAHSWSGNLVTNETWNDFWLNEGFTVYIEHRIMEELYGKEMANMLCEIEHYELNEELKSIAISSHPEDSRLYLSLKGRNPDDGMTSVAYVKGAYFLKTLEATVGRKKMDAFVKQYFETYKFKTIRTEGFHTFLNQQLLYPNHVEFNTDEWFYLEGLPVNSIVIKSKRLEFMRKLAARTNTGEDIFAPVKKIRWVKVKGKKKKRKEVYIEQLNPSLYITQEWQTYLRNLSLSIDTNRLDQMEVYTHFNKANNELKFEWFLLNIRKENHSVRPDLALFLKETGRRKYILPLYKALCEHPKDKSWAYSIFKQANGGYHSVSRKSIEAVFEN